MIDRRFLKTTRQECWRQANRGKRLLSTYGIYAMVESKHKKEFFMAARQMRIYWDEPHAPLYYPLRLYSRYLKFYVSGYTPADWAKDATEIAQENSNVKS